MKKTLLRWKRRILGGAVVVVAMAAGLFLCLRPPSLFRVQEVVVLTPLVHLSDFDLTRLSGVKKGDNLLTLSLSTVRSKILRFPWIREVRLSKRFPGRLLIAAEEEVAVALLEIAGRNKGGVYLLNREGIVFKQWGSGDVRDLPVITGLSEEDLATWSKPLLALVVAFEGSPSLASVGLSEIHWGGGKGVSLFTREPCVRVDLGREPTGEKLGRLAAAWETIRATAKRPKVIDLSLEKRIIVKKVAAYAPGMVSSEPTPTRSIRPAKSVSPKRVGVLPLSTSNSRAQSDFSGSFSLVPAQGSSESSRGRRQSQTGLNESERSRIYSAE